MAPVRHIVLSSEVELCLHSRFPQTWPDGNSERTWHLRSSHVSTLCGQLGLIHPFLHAQPTPVDICHLTKYLMPFIYPFLIRSIPPLFLPFSLQLMSLCSPVSMPSSLFCMLYSPLIVYYVLSCLKAANYYYYYYFIKILLLLLKSLLWTSGLKTSSCGNEPRTLSPRAYTTLTSCFFLAVYFEKNCYKISGSWKNIFIRVTKSNLSDETVTINKPARCEWGVSPGSWAFAARCRMKIIIIILFQHTAWQNITHHSRS